MKKATIILVLIILIVLLFVFQTLYTWFSDLESVNFAAIRNPRGVMQNIAKMRKMFSALSMMVGLLVIGTGIYLMIQFKKPKPKEGIAPIPPLQNYLLQLKGSETQLKDMVEKQQVHVTEKDELNKSIINNINAAVMVLNPSRRVDTFNTVAQQLFSQSFVNVKNNLLGAVLSKYPEIVTFVDTNAEEKTSAEVQSNGRYFSIDSNPLENIGQLVIVRDITEEKRREEFERNNGNFIMLGEMAAFLAHEVRNSLGVIYGYTKTIKSEKEKTKTEKVNKEINFLTAMMENFLNFSKPVKVTKGETIDLAVLFQSVADETGIALELEPKKGGEPAGVLPDTDPALVHSIVSNLLLNAGEAGADTVEVSIDTPGDEKLEITLTDNGNGVPEDIREKIWFPFFTTKEKGTGMGLAIIRKIVHSLNGEIALTASGSEGTTFRITFYG
ncbi:MAG: hypothetical protein GY940_36455 [bacterium]|nr:hypothetical protein [bacterium]